MKGSKESKKEGIKLKKDVEEKEEKEKQVKEESKMRMKERKVSFHKKVFTNILGNENNLGILKNWMSHILDEEVKEIEYLCSMSYEEAESEVTVHALFSVNYGYRHLVFSFGKKEDKDIDDYFVQNGDGMVLTHGFAARRFNMDKIMEYWKKENKEKIEEFKYIIMLNLPSVEIKKLDAEDELIDRFSYEVKRLEENLCYKENSCDIVVKKETVDEKNK